jgi:hypothetical protein
MPLVSVSRYLKRQSNLILDAKSRSKDRNQLFNTCALYLFPGISRDRATSSWMPRAGAKIEISCPTHAPCFCFQVPQETEQPHPGCQEQEQERRQKKIDRYYRKGKTKYNKSKKEKGQWAN